MSKKGLNISIALSHFHYTEVVLHPVIDCVALLLSRHLNTCTSLLSQDHSQAEAEPDVAWDVENIASDEDGLVIYDGGTYSRGPTAVFDGSGDASPDQDEALEADKERLERQLSLEVTSQLHTCRPAPCASKSMRKPRGSRCPAALCALSLMLWSSSRPCQLLGGMMQYPTVTYHLHRKICFGPSMHG